MADERRRWLVIVPGGLGDTLSFWPLIRIIQKRLSVTIDIATKGFLVDFISGIEGVGSVYDYEKNEIGDTEYEWLINCATNDSAIGYANKCRFSHLVTRRINDASEFFYIDGIPRAIDVFRVNGTGIYGDPNLPAWMVEAPMFAAILRENHWEWLRQELDSPIFLFRKAATEPTRTVYLIPAGSVNNKKWPISSFIALGQSLKLAGFNILFVLGSMERNYRALLIESDFTIINEMGIADLARELSSAALVVANDCGLMHLAAGIGVPTLAIFGPTNPSCWFFYSKISSRFRYLQEPSEDFDPWGVLLDSEIAWPIWPDPADVVAVALAMLVEAATQKPS
jgi:hypothetical protein